MLYFVNLCFISKVQLNLKIIKGRFVCTALDVYINAEKLGQFVSVETG